MSKLKLTYLGDSVYVQPDERDRLILFLNNGERDWDTDEILRKNEIVIEPEVALGLSSYLARYFDNLKSPEE